MENNRDTAPSDIAQPLERLAQQGSGASSGLWSTVQDTAATALATAAEVAGVVEGVVEEVARGAYQSITGRDAGHDTEEAVHRVQELGREASSSIQVQAAKAKHEILDVLGESGGPPAGDAFAPERDFKM
eukprot:ANDGO_04050.mRNA.1 hypothetical protein